MWQLSCLAIARIQEPRADRAGGLPGAEKRQEKRSYSEEESRMRAKQAAKSAFRGLCITDEINVLLEIKIHC